MSSRNLNLQTSNNNNNNNSYDYDDDGDYSEIENGEHLAEVDRKPVTDATTPNNESTSSEQRHTLSSTNNNKEQQHQHSGGNASPSSSSCATKQTILTTTTSSSSSNNNSNITIIIEEAENPKQVWKSKFVILQLIINLILGFLGPLATFYLLFGFLSQGPYEWSSGPLVGVVVGSLVGSPILIFALMPVGLPEAVEKGWFPKLSIENCQPLILRLFLNWKWATLRNIAWTLLIGCILVPIALIVARYGLGPTLSTWQLIWFNVVYEVILAIPVVYIGLLGYSVHLESILEKMSHHPNLWKRLLYRTLSSLKMTVCPPPKSH